MCKESGLRILAVDNDVDTADSFATLLRLWGHDVEVCYHAPAALEKARNYRPRVVLLDVAMPGMDGFRVAALLRGPPELANLVIVGISGYTGETSRRRAREAGFDHYLLEPVSPDDLCEVLGRVTRINAKEDDSYADVDSASTPAGRAGRASWPCEPDKVLVADARNVLTPSQMVDRKLLALLDTCRTRFFLRRTGRPGDVRRALGDQEGLDSRPARATPA